MMQLTALIPGMTVGLWSPASSVKPEQVEKGLATLQKYGYSFRFAKHAFDQNHMVAASIEERIADFHEMLNDPEIGAIWALRGGYGTMQLLPYLDYQLLKRSAKLIVGFSDVTAFQWGIYAKASVPSLSGLTITTQFTDDNPYLPAACQILSGQKNELTEVDFIDNEVRIHQTGEAEGILLGGTLSMICALTGTPYFPDDDNIILFIEDVDEPLYRIDRLFWQMALGGFWQKVRGVILGKYLYQNRLLDVYEQLKPLIAADIPVISNFPYGHLPQCLPLPMGVKANFQTKPLSLSWKPFLIGLNA
jgi:muramoyltetrapeptide carboxypeptidase